MLTIQARQQRVGAGELHLAFEDRRVTRRARPARQTIEQVSGERVERRLHSFDAALRSIEQMVDSDAMHPRRERRIPPERRQACDDPDQDLLGGIFGVGRPGRHTQRQPIDTISHRHHEVVESHSIAGLRGPHVGSEHVRVVEDRRLAHRVSVAPRGWSINTSQLPSGCRRRTSAPTPPSRCVDQSGSSAVNVHEFDTIAMSSTITTSDSPV